MKPSEKVAIFTVLTLFLMYFLIIGLIIYFVIKGIFKSALVLALVFCAMSVFIHNLFCWAVEEKENKDE